MRSMSLSFPQRQAQKSSLRLDLYREQIRNSPFICLLFNCLKGKDTILGLCWFLPSPAKCYFWLLPAGKKKMHKHEAWVRLGLRLGLGSEQRLSWAAGSHTEASLSTGCRGRLGSRRFRKGSTLLPQMLSCLSGGSRGAQEDSLEVGGAAEPHRMP